MSVQPKFEETSVATRTFEALRAEFDTRFALEFLAIACDGDLYVFGGTVRDAVLGRGRAGDLDIMVPNGDTRAFAALDRVRVPFGHNSQGHRRYRWNTLQLDIFEPSQFFKGFGSVDHAVAYFDLRINALAVHVASRRVLDPIDGLASLANRDPGINWTRWLDIPPEEVQVLMIRLVRLLHDVPQLRLSRRDAERLLVEMLPQIEQCDWTSAQARFPLGRARFLEVSNEVLRRAAGLDRLSR